MNTTSKLMSLIAVLLVSASLAPVASAHKLRKSGETVTIANSRMSVTPSRDWNLLSQSPGKQAETWTLDGEKLDDVTFYAAIEPGDALVKEHHKKSEPLPKFRKSTLLVEVPELLESTYRADRGIKSFNVTATEPATFLAHKAVHFTYDYTDDDLLTRKGDATATIVDGKLYMATFDAPRLEYFDKVIGDARALVATAKL